MLEEGSREKWWRSNKRNHSHSKWATCRWSLVDTGTVRSDRGPHNTSKSQFHLNDQQLFGFFFLSSVIQNGASCLGRSWSSGPWASPITLSIQICVKIKKKKIYWLACKWTRNKRNLLQNVKCLQNNKIRLNWTREWVKQLDKVCSINVIFMEINSQNIHSKAFWAAETKHTFILLNGILDYEHTHKRNKNKTQILFSVITTANKQFQYFWKRATFFFISFFQVELASWFFCLALNAINLLIFFGFDSCDLL